MHASVIAWQPFTPGGVAAFARARLIHLLVLQLAVALLIAGAVLWFLSTAWFPIIHSAIQELPPGGRIRHGRLAWPKESAVVLAQNHFLALAVDLQHQGQVRSPAHVQVEFGGTSIRAFSLLGMMESRYPSRWIIAFNREELLPWWGAWSPALLAIASAAVVLWLFLNWFALATIYCPIAWLVGLFADRDLTLRMAWRLAGAALMPGALFLGAAILLYTLGALDVVRLLLAGLVHFVIGWAYLVASPFWCPRHPSLSAVKGNPFPGNAPPRSPPPTPPADPPADADKPSPPRDAEL